MKIPYLLAFALLAPLLPPATAQQATPSPDLKLTMEILSDTSGAAMSPYVRTLISVVREHWLPLVAAAAPNLLLPQRQESAISITLGRNGEIQAMHLDSSTHDSALDKAAWGAVASTAYAPPPPATAQPSLKLRIHFIVD